MIGDVIGAEAWHPVKHITYLHLLSIKSLIYAIYSNTHMHTKKKQTNKQTNRQTTMDGRGQGYRMYYG